MAKTQRQSGTQACYRAGKVTKVTIKGGANESDESDENGLLLVAGFFKGTTCRVAWHITP